MRERRAIGVLLLCSAFILLTTCQMQFNKSAGNNATLRVVVPGGASGGGKGAPGSKSLAGGASLTVTIKQGTTSIAQQSVPLSGGTSVDFSFSSLSSGTYDVLADMMDASGTITLAQNTTKLTVPSGNFPVVLTLDSSLLSNAVISGSSSAPTYAFGPTFNPTTFTYSSVSPALNQSFLPYTLTLTTVDPNATITSVTEPNANGDQIPDSHIGSVYTLALVIDFGTVTIVVTAADGTTTQTYTMAVQASWRG